jgi:hypothetical protein
MEMGPSDSSSAARECSSWAPPEPVDLSRLADLSCRTFFSGITGFERVIPAHFLILPSASVAGPLGASHVVTLVSLLM